ncbi:MAG TPA: ankyrin repeat domain-containing protein [Pirellulales bacterium]|nr:ankyrin repeat domain-containing protein [Pirellulales bacterium]
MSRPLPLRANLDWLKKLSKERLEALRATDPNAKLSDAQLAVAREFGFASWRKLKGHVVQLRAQLDVIVPPELLRRAATDAVSPDDADLAELLAAVHAGDERAVADVLARRPALAAAHGPEGQTPLHLAAQFNDPRLAAVLVAYGANLNAKFGKSGHTPLSWAATCHALECARALIQLGAEADLFCAAGVGALAEVQACFDAEGALRPGASRTGSSRVASDGSRLPCPPAAAIEQLSDALYIACRTGQAEVVQFLLGKGPDLSFRAYLGGTPLHWAYFGGSRTTIELVEQAGADRTARDDVLRCTPRAFGIAIAANWGFDFIVKKLLSGDAGLANAVDRHTSPLHEAARGGHLHVVRVLLDHHADRHFRDAAGKTPLETARDGGHASVVELLSS